MRRELTDAEAMRLALHERDRQLAFMTSIVRNRGERLRLMTRLAKDLGRRALVDVLRRRFLELADRDSNPA